jgi:hypothetical protein
VLYSNDLQSHEYLTRRSSNALDWHPDSRRLAVISGDYHLTIWDVVNKTQIVRENAHDGDYLYTLLWNQDGSLLVSFGTDYILRIWNASLELVKVIPIDIYIDPHKWRLDNRHLLADSIGAWVEIDTVSGNITTYPVEELENGSIGDWTPNNKYIVTNGFELIDAATGEYASSYLCSAGSGILARFSPDGKHLFQYGTDAESGSVCLTSLDDQFRSADFKFVYKAHKGQITDVAWSPDSQQLVTVTWGGLVNLIDVATGNLLKTGLVPRANFVFMSYLHEERWCMDIDVAEYLDRRLALNDLAGYEEALRINLELGYVSQFCIDELLSMVDYFKVHPTPTPDARPKQALVIDPLCSPEPDRYLQWRVRNPNWHDVELEAKWSSVNSRISYVIPAAENGVEGEYVLKLYYKDRVAEGTEATFESRDFMMVSQGNTGACISATATATRISTITPTPTATFTPTATLVIPPSFAKLRLTSMCSADPALTRRWRVRNSNTFPLPFTWEIYGNGQAGSGVAVANGDVFFESNTVNGANTLRLFVGGKLQEVKANGGARCP